MKSTIKLRVPSICTPLFVLPTTEKRHTVPISVVDFAPGEKDLVDNPSFSVTLSGLVQETRQPIYDREEFSPIVPDVELTVSSIPITKHHINCNL